MTDALHTNNMVTLKLKLKVEGGINSRGFGKQTKNQEGWSKAWGLVNTHGQAFVIS